MNQCPKCGAESEEKRTTHIAILYECESGHEFWL